MQVERTAAGIFGVQIDFECLTHRVGLDEVAFVVEVEPVLGCMFLQVGHEPGEVDCCHWVYSFARLMRGRYPCPVLSLS